MNINRVLSGILGKVGLSLVNSVRNFCKLGNCSFLFLSHPLLPYLQVLSVSSLSLALFLPFLLLLRFLFLFVKI